MMNTIHRLSDDNEISDWLPASQLENYCPNSFDFEWNADYTMFRVVPLRWVDDASYASYQSADLDE